MSSWDRNMRHGGRGPRGGNRNFRGGWRGRNRNNWHNNSYQSVPNFSGNYQPRAGNVEYNNYGEVLSHQYQHPPPSYPGISALGDYQPRLRNSQIIPVQEKPPPRSETPLPGTEEYTQSKIQQTTEFIKRHLNMDSSEVNAANSSEFQPPNRLSPKLNDCDMNRFKVSEKSNDNNATNAVQRKLGRVQPRTQRVNKAINVQEICDKIIHHISNLNYTKKMNLVNQPGSTGYDFAMQQVQKQKRLELSRALRNISNRPTQDSTDSEVIKSIIPDFGIKIEDLPREVIAELSTTLNCDVEEFRSESMNPDEFFKQAQQICDNFDRSSDFDQFLPNFSLNMRPSTSEVFDDHLPSSQSPHSSVISEPPSSCMFSSPRHQSEKFRSKTLDSTPIYNMGDSNSNQTKMYCSPLSGQTLSPANSHTFIDNSCSYDESRIFNTGNPTQLKEGLDSPRFLQDTCFTQETSILNENPSRFLQDCCFDKAPPISHDFLDFNPETNTNVQPELHPSDLNEKQEYPALTVRKDLGSSDFMFSQGETPTSDSAKTDATTKKKLVLKRYNPSEKESSQQSNTNSEALDIKKEPEMCHMYIPSLSDHFLKLSQSEGSYSETEKSKTSELGLDVRLSEDGTDKSKCSPINLRSTKEGIEDLPQTSSTKTNQIAEEHLKIPEPVGTKKKTWRSLGEKKQIPNSLLNSFDPDDEVLDYEMSETSMKLSDANDEIDFSINEEADSIIENNVNLLKVAAIDDPNSSYNSLPQQAERYDETMNALIANTSPTLFSEIENDQIDEPSQLNLLNIDEFSETLPPIENQLPSTSKAYKSFSVPNEINIDTSIQNEKQNFVQDTITATQLPTEENVQPSKNEQSCESSQTRIEELEVDSMKDLCNNGEEATFTAQKTKGIDDLVRDQQNQNFTLKTNEQISNKAKSTVPEVMKENEESKEAKRENIQESAENSTKNRPIDDKGLEKDNIPPNQNKTSKEMPKIKDKEQSEQKSTSKDVTKRKVDEIKLEVPDKKGSPTKDKGRRNDERKDTRSKDRSRATPDSKKTDSRKSASKDRKRSKSRDRSYRDESSKVESQSRSKVSKDKIESRSKDEKETRNREEKELKHREEVDCRNSEKSTARRQNDSKKVAKKDRDNSDSKTSNTKKDLSKSKKADDLNKAEKSKSSEDKSKITDKQKQHERDKYKTMKKTDEKERNKEGKRKYGVEDRKSNETSSKKQRIEEAASEPKKQVICASVEVQTVKESPKKMVTKYMQTKCVETVAVGMQTEKKFHKSVSNQTEICESEAKQFASASVQTDDENLVESQKLDLQETMSVSSQDNPEGVNRILHRLQIVNKHMLSLQREQQMLYDEVLKYFSEKKLPVEMLPPHEETENVRNYAQKPTVFQAEATTTEITKDSNSNNSIRPKRRKTQTQNKEIDTANVIDNDKNVRSLRSHDTEFVSNDQKHSNISFNDNPIPETLPVVVGEPNEQLVSSSSISIKIPINTLEYQESILSPTVDKAHTSKSKKSKKKGKSRKRRGHKVHESKETVDEMDIGKIDINNINEQNDLQGFGNESRSPQEEQVDDKALKKSKRRTRASNSEKTHVDEAIDEVLRQCTEENRETSPQVNEPIKIKFRKNKTYEIAQTVPSINAQTMEMEAYIEPQLEETSSENVKRKRNNSDSESLNNVKSDVMKRARLERTPSVQENVEEIQEPCSEVEGSEEIYENSSENYSHRSFEPFPVLKYLTVNLTRLDISPFALPSHSKDMDLESAEEKHEDDESKEAQNSETNNSFTKVSNWLRDNNHDLETKPASLYEEDIKLDILRKIQFDQFSDQTDMEVKNDETLRNEVCNISKTDEIPLNLNLECSSAINSSNNDLEQTFDSARTGTPDVPSKMEDHFLLRYQGFQGVILVVKIIGDTLLAASDEGHIYGYNWKTGELISSIKISTRPVTSLCIVGNSEKSIYFGSLDGKISLFNQEKSEVTQTIKLADGIHCIEHAWGFLFCGSYRGSIIRYSIENDVDNTERISDQSVLMLKATQEGSRKILLVATRNCPVTVRDAMSCLLLRSISTPSTVYTMLLQESTLYFGTSQHDILVYTFHEGKQLCMYKASKGVVCMQIVGNLLFAACYNGNIYVFNVQTNESLGSIAGPGGLLLSMQIEEDHIIVGSKNSHLICMKIPQRFLDQR